MGLHLCVERPWDINVVTFVAVSLAVMHKRVSCRFDNDDNVVRLTSSQLSAAKEIGDRLVKYWSGPL